MSTKKFQNYSCIPLKAEGKQGDNFERKRYNKANLHALAGALQIIYGHFFIISAMAQN